MIWIESVEKPKVSYGIVFETYESSYKNWFDVVSYILDHGIEHENKTTYNHGELPRWIKIRITSDEWHKILDDLKFKVNYSKTYNKIYI